MKKTVVRVGIGLVVVVAVAGAALWAVRPAWLLTQAGLARRAKDYGLYCKEHGVPEKFCTICHAELKDKLLLCTEHGNIPEDICTLCHPEARDKNDIEMCPKGHGLPKHFCSRCDAEAGKPAASGNLYDDGYFVAFGPKGGGAKTVCELLPLVRLASSGLANEVGLATAPVVEEEHTHELSAPAETAYDASRYAEVTPRVAGFLREARADLGQRVAPGETLAVVDSAEVSTAKAQYFASKATQEYEEDRFRRVDTLTSSDLMASKQRPAAVAALNQARAASLGAEQKLRNFRFDDTALDTILKGHDTTPLLDVVSPVEGTVVFRHAVVGESVEPTTKLYAVADVSKLSLWIDVFERDIRRVLPGQAVTFTVSGSVSADEEATYSGKITWVGTEVDGKTRTTRVRAEVPNRDGLLRAHQFGRARVQVGTPHRAVMIPRDAVQRYENVEMVFVEQKEGVYRPQRIRTVPTGRSGALEVTWGLKPGENVVTTGSFLLKTEIMKGSIGAGCCD